MAASLKQKPAFATGLGLELVSMEREVWRKGDQPAFRLIFDKREHFYQLRERGLSGTRRKAYELLVFYGNYSEPA
ncbi:MAG: hypothetical protein QOD80_364 [Verrucomicrobiota bacterium]|jgi:hypothetical protein